MEMNINMAQKPDAIAEIKELMTTNETFISSKDSSPMLVVQLDVMTGWYKFTYGGIVEIPKHHFFDSISRLDIVEMVAKMDHIRKVYRTTLIYEEEKNKMKEKYPSLSEDDLNEKVSDRILYSGYGLFSMLMPTNFQYQIQNNISPDRKPVVVYRGVLLSGTLDKIALGSSSGSLLHNIAKDYGNKYASEFIKNLQYFINDNLQFLGFSCGMEDFIPIKRDEIEQTMYNSLYKAFQTMINEPDPVVREDKIQDYLGFPREQGKAYAQNALSKDNNLVVQVKSGSKGNWANIAEITSIIGQQIISGDKRISKLFGGRTLSCFPRSSWRSTDPDQLPPDGDFFDAERIFQSRGFIKSSYFEGMKPIEYFLISAGGREGLIHTAVTTADTGYIQRKIAKILEDLQMSYVGTVNDINQNVIQFSYGGDNMDAARLIKVTPEDQSKPFLAFIDIGHVSKMLNNSFEIAA